ncbi:MAG: hypothetical protein VW995_08440 [Deltaproteobacteria bacterium]|jgi:hypothetical protein
METQSEIDEVVLSNVVESLLGKISTNLDISMQVLEAVRNEQSVQLRKTMQDNQNKFMSSLFAASQPQVIWPEFIRQSGENFRTFLEFQRHSYLMMELSWRLPMFCMLSPEDFIREVRKILPNEEDQIIQVLRELENRLDSIQHSSLTTH